MDSSQLIDSLTAHVALYHSSASSTSSSPSINPRASILRWFSSLNVHQRQSSLTIVDAKFTQILIQMQKKLHNHGHGFFIILPDLPSRYHPSLPSLCFRRSRGLLARASSSNESELSIFNAVQMFSSIEGEGVEGCSCSVGGLDSITVSEDFVGELNHFVAVMDGISNGQFLRGEGSILGSSWEELPWLKAKGYYSMEAFVANKLELALRLSWLNCNAGKKRGPKLKEKANIAGIAANVYWRKKGCLDWWIGLDSSVRKKTFRVALGKAAKYLTNEIVKAANDTLGNEVCFCSTRAEQSLMYSTISHQRTARMLSVAEAEICLVLPSPTSGKYGSLANLFKGLLVLQEISMMVSSCRHGGYEKERLFFSTLGSVLTISDCILRKLRGLLMVVSSDCIKLELLGEGKLKASINKSEQKLGAGSRRGKGKSRSLKRKNLVLKSSGANFAVEKCPEEHECRLAHPDHSELVKANGESGAHLGKDSHDETSLPGVQMEHAKNKVQTTGKKHKKESSRSKRSNLNETIKLDSDVRTLQTTSQPVTFQPEVAKDNMLSNTSAVHNLPTDIPMGGNNIIPNSSFCISTSKPNKEDSAEVAQNSQEESVVGSTECSPHIGLECLFFPNTTAGTNATSRVETVHATPALELDNIIKNKEHIREGSGQEPDNVITNKELKHQSSGQLSATAAVSPLLKESINFNEESTLFQKQESGNCYSHCPTSSSGCTSYEWPSIAPVHFPSVNSQHLPAATDRLHLDVGCNWRNQFHQSYLSTRHQSRNSLVEGGCSRIMPQTSLSLDWPPVVQSSSRLTPSVACNYDSGFIPRMQSPFRQSFTPHGLQLNGMMPEDDRKHSGDVIDSCDLTKASELADDCDSHWVSEEEFEMHAFSGRDYNQYFGGGVMYWNTSDHAGTGFSRPPSLSSDDSSWAWHEADLNRTIDDMVGFSSSYSTNGLTSPPASPFCSPFDPLGSGHQSLGYVMSGNDVTSKVLHSSSVTDGVPEENTTGSLANSPGGVVEGQTGDSLAYPILRPIIIPNMSRKGSEFKLSRDHKSPCIPPTKREQPRIKRPPSPVVLCVPRAPHPPPPSPVGDSRKQRGFPTVRSGSSSPRHWGMRSWYHDGTNCEEARLCVDGAEVIWPSWGNKGLSATSMIQPLPGSLLQDRLIAISQLALDQEHPDVAFPVQPPELLNCPARKTLVSLMHSLLHDEIDSFCNQVAAQNLARKPYINWAVKRVGRSLQVLWPRSRTNIFGSYATGLSLPTSDVDLVVCLPPVRNLHAARYLANQEWVKNDSLKTVENTAIPIIMLVAEVPLDLSATTGKLSNVQTPNIESTQMTGKLDCTTQSDIMGLSNSSWPKCSSVENDNAMDVKSVRLDISFKSPSHTGLQTTELVRGLTEQFPAATPLALVLKQFLADRSLDHSYSGGLSSYCLVLLIIRFLQHEHHLGRSINQNLGSLLMDFLYFFGNVFDPRQMRISIQGSGIYVNRERGHCIDPIHIDDPLFPTNNVGRNCFRIHQCIKAFADAYSTLENELTCLPSDSDSRTRQSYKLLPKIIPSLGLS
uniref:Polymerase nucleotidyl transferase domain-containing protein n=1 Tax=Nelumbo nucifera TaxID=4432 RepID=A0A822XHM1_NELNU|nr:TPA_asm: hypothetical protein HUJ06_019969 [Nelumbo nucifera]